MNKKHISLLIPIKNEGGSKSIWLQERLTKDFLEGKMEFVGGKREADETNNECCIRETHEEVGILLNVDDLKFFKTYTHQYEHFEVELNCYLYEDNSGIFEESGWRKLSDKSIQSLKLEIPPANEVIINELNLCNYNDLVADK